MELKESAVKSTHELNWRRFCYDQHDIVCNQKYGKELPYSFHLECVREQVLKFEYLLPLNLIPAPHSIIQGPQYSKERVWVRMGAAGHDLIEDARLTYNDIKEKVGMEVAEIIFLCTESKGRNRIARHSKEFYEDLATNKLAVFVKLCDIIANVKFSLLTNSKMLDKYRMEHEKTIEYLYCKEFKPMFDYLQRLFEVV